jgi:hypothetical protein
LRSSMQTNAPVRLPALSIAETAGAVVAFQKS